MKLNAAARLVVSLVPILVACWGKLSAQASSGTLFRDVTDKAGIDFMHDPGADGSYFMPEIMGSGGAFLDADNDGDLDVYLIQAGPHSGAVKILCPGVPAGGQDPGANERRRVCAAKLPQSR